MSIQVFRSMQTITTTSIEITENNKITYSNRDVETTNYNEHFIIANNSLRYIRSSFAAIS